MISVMLSKFKGGVEECNATLYKLLKPGKANEIILVV